MDTARDLMEFLITRKAPHLPPSAIGDVLDSLIWRLDEKNSSEILEIREEWLERDDLVKVEVALSMDETFPYQDEERMIQVFDQICDKWPNLKSRCDELRHMRIASDPSRSRPKNSFTSLDWLRRVFRRSH